MDTKSTDTLLNYQGMISNVAIENHDHDRALGRLDILIAMHGPLALVEWEQLQDILYD